MPVEIYDLQDLLSLDLDRVERAARLAAAPCEEPDLSISLIRDAEIREVNRLHLSHDHPTDVISFDYGESAEVISGEVLVSVETALRVAKKRGCDPEAEVILYVVHGVLHLNGFDDKDPDSARAMRRRQRELVRESGY